MQRIFRRRSSGPAGRGAGGPLGRLPSGLLRGRSGANRLPWGKKAAATAPAAPGHALQDTQATHVIVQHDPAGAGAGASFRDRGKLRRRLRYLRRARELAFRDIGGLMFDMRRFGRDRPDLVEAKISALAAVDQELRALERILDDRRPLHELREPGITSCARCGALHSSDSNFCPNCGLQVGGPRAMGEVGGAIAGPPQPPLEPVHQATPANAVGPAQAPDPAPAAPPAAASAPPPPPPAPPAEPPPPPPASAPPAPSRPASSTVAQPTETMLPPRAPDDGA